MSDTKFYRTVVTIEILGDEPWDGDLSWLGYDITDGDFSGAELSRETTEVDRDAMGALLEAQGSDPSFLLGEADDEEV